MLSTAAVEQAASNDPVVAFITTVGIVAVSAITAWGARRAQGKKDARDEAPADNPWHALAAAYTLIGRLRSALVRQHDYAQRKSTPEDPAPRVDPDLLEG